MTQIHTRGETDKLTVSDLALVETRGGLSSQTVSLGTEGVGWRSWGLTGPYGVPGPGLGAL